MTSSPLPRILVVDDEEAILETMTFTFMDTYEVITSSDARKALALLDDHAPVAVAISDQRMPNMTGTEFLAEIYERHPETVRIMLTGFADIEATVQAINDGHVYAYITKPWEPDALKQVVKRAVEYHQLIVENNRLMQDLARANIFLEGVMDRLDTGALAIDADGIIRAVNQPARSYLEIDGDPRGRDLREILTRKGLESLGAAIEKLMDEAGGCFEDVELRVGASAHRIRVSSQTLADQSGDAQGRVIQFREVSHEPLRRRFDDIVGTVSAVDGELRPRLEAAVEDLQGLTNDLRATRIASPGMAELTERASRTQTAMQNWLDVDDVMVREDYPDAQLLLDRMRVATERWPRSESVPDRVQQLAQQVEDYYESGENSKQRVL
ncbi:MAG: response regulator [Proteobacteria bacterium]|nr:response regulator [Pseudomonadota bacterium]